MNHIFNLVHLLDPHLFPRRRPLSLPLFLPIYLPISLPLYLLLSLPLYALFPVFLSVLLSLPLSLLISLPIFLRRECRCSGGVGVFDYFLSALGLPEDKPVLRATRR